MDWSFKKLDNDVLLNQRPAYTKTIGYNLKEISSVIIIKGGKIFMTKTILEPREGYENIFAELNAKKKTLDVSKQIAIKQALDEVEARFTEEASRIDSALNVISVKTIVEEPDEDPVEEVVCEEPFQESTEDSAQE